MPDQITITAPAKLNLALSVGPRGPDGMHPIATWMVAIDLADELTITRLAADRFSRYAILWHEEARRRSEIDWPIQADLAVRAHLALEKAAGRRLPVQLKLEKRIPVGGGLGGGSSNAAAMLRGVNTLFELGLSDDRLRAIGRTVSSDVPFFIDGGSAIVEGTGEIVHHHDEPRELHAVIVFPDIVCSTADVYRVFDEIESAGLRAERVRALGGAARLDPAALFNDLAEPALRIAPALREPLAAISALAERPAMISGSGSSIFVICDDPIHAEALAAAIESRLDLPALAVRTVGRETADARR